MKIILTDLETNKQKIIYSGCEFFERISREDKQEIIEDTVNKILKSSFLLAYPDAFFNVKFKSCHPKTRN